MANPHTTKEPMQPPMTRALLEQMQPLSDTPLRIVSSKPGRLTAVGQVTGQLPAHLARIAALPAIRRVEVTDRSSLHRLDELGAVISCTWFGGLPSSRSPTSRASSRAAATTRAAGQQPRSGSSLGCEGPRPAWRRAQRHAPRGPAGRSWPIR